MIHAKHGELPWDKYAHEKFIHRGENSLTLPEAASYFGLDRPTMFKVIREYRVRAGHKDRNIPTFRFADLKKAVEEYREEQAKLRPATPFPSTDPIPKPRKAYVQKEINMAEAEHELCDLSRATQVLKKGSEAETVELLNHWNITKRDATGKVFWMEDIVALAETLSEVAVVPSTKEEPPVLQNGLKEVAAPPSAPTKVEDKPRATEPVTKTPVRRYTYPAAREILGISHSQIYAARYDKVVPERVDKDGVLYLTDLDLDVIRKNRLKKGLRVNPAVPAATPPEPAPTPSKAVQELRASRKAFTETVTPYFGSVVPLAAAPQPQRNLTNIPLNEVVSLTFVDYAEKFVSLPTTSQLLNLSLGEVDRAANNNLLRWVVVQTPVSSDRLIEKASICKYKELSNIPHSLHFTLTQGDRENLGAIRKHLQGRKPDVTIEECVTWALLTAKQTIS